MKQNVANDARSTDEHELTNRKKSKRKQKKQRKFTSIWFVYSGTTFSLEHQSFLSLSLMQLFQLMPNIFACESAFLAQQPKWYEKNTPKWFLIILCPLRIVRNDKKRIVEVKYSLEFVWTMFWAFFVSAEFDFGMDVLFVGLLGMLFGER